MREDFYRLSCFLLHLLGKIGFFYSASPSLLMRMGGMFCWIYEFLMVRVDGPCLVV
jgi:hypothetical protein